MIAWLATNFNPGTLLVLAIVALIVGLVLRSLIRDKKAGIHSCGGSCGSGGCSACGGACSACSGGCGQTK